MERSPDQVDRAPRRGSVGWWVLTGVCVVVGALALCFSVAALVARPGEYVAGGDVPTGHPHGEIVGPEVLITCPSVVGYATGDRDPLCRSTIRGFSIVAIVTILVGVLCAVIGLWSVRRARVRERDGDHRRHALSVAASGLVALMGAVGLIVCVLAIVLPTNGGNWADAPSTPPPVPGLDEWRHRVGPPMNELGSEAGSLQTALEAHGTSAGSLDCAALGDTVDRLAAASAGAPDDALAAYSATAIKDAQAAVAACDSAVRAEDLGSLAGFVFQLSAAADDWNPVVERVLVLRLGPG